MSKKILLLGDSCLDRYVYGYCKKINQEAPVPILDFKEIKEQGGMAQNVFNNLKSFDLNVDFVTNQKKIIKTRFIDIKNGQQILRVDDDIEIDKSNIKIKDIYDYDIVVISDYNKGLISKELLFKICDTNKTIFVDSKKTDLPKNKCFIKINKNEYEKLLNKELHSNLIVTQGELGAVYNGKKFPTEKADSPNITGAGDTFLSGLVFGFIFTNDIEKSIRIANKAAFIAVSRPGTYVLKNEDVKKIRDFAKKIS